MKIEIDDISKAGHLFYHTPVLITSMSRDGKPNVCTNSWNTRIGYQRPIVTVAVYNGMEEGKRRTYTNELLRENGDFVINVPNISLLKAVHFCGRHSGRAMNKFDAAGLTPLQAKKIRGVLIKECVANIECKGIGMFDIPLADHTVFVGDVVALHVDDEYYDEKTGYLDFSKSNLLIEGSSYSYLKVGDEIALQELPRGVHVYFKEKYKKYDVELPYEKSNMQNNKIVVKFYSDVRGTVGLSSIVMEIEENTSISSLIKLLCQKFPDTFAKIIHEPNTNKLNGSITIFINSIPISMLKGENSPIKKNDVVAFFSAVSGG